MRATKEGRRSRIVYRNIVRGTTQSISTGIDSLFDFEGQTYDFIIDNVFIRNNNDALRNAWSTIGNELREAARSLNTPRR